MRLLPQHKAVAQGRTIPSDGPSASRLAPAIGIVMVLAIYAALAGYWFVAGRLPGPEGTALLSEAMPPRSGPERPQSALLKPPAAPAAVPSRPPAAEIAGPETISVAPAPSPIPPVPEGRPLPPPNLAELPAAPPAQPLPPAPLPELVKNSSHAGELPVIGPGGRQAWQAYARPFAGPPGQPRLAVLVSGLGLSKQVTEAAIDKLPADVTLGFSPYARDLQGWISRARAAGHEVLLELPMEPRRYPARDPGALGLLTALPPAQVMARLERVMASAGGYVGLAAPSGSPFAAGPAVKPVLQDLKRRGLLYVGDGAAAGGPAFVPVSVVLDTQPSRDAIDAGLGQLSAAARKAGAALGVTEPLPVAIERLASWLPGLAAQGILLAPVSALANVPPPS